MNAYDIIRRPVITEQSMESVADKKYVFMVDVNANKTEIKAAIEEIFGVKVAKVNTVRMQGKVKRTGAYPNCSSTSLPNEKPSVSRLYHHKLDICLLTNLLPPKYSVCVKRGT